MIIFAATTVRLQAAFATYDGLSIDPTSVVVRVTDPTGPIVTSTFPAVNWQHPSTGVYQFDVEVVESGMWQFSFSGTGNIDSYNESRFLVHDKGF